MLFPMFSSKWASGEDNDCLLICSQENWVKWSPVHHIFNYFLSDYFGNASIPVILLQVLPLLLAMIPPQLSGHRRNHRVVLLYEVHFSKISLRPHSPSWFYFFQLRSLYWARCYVQLRPVYSELPVIRHFWLFNIVFNQMNLPQPLHLPHNCYFKLINLLIWELCWVFLAAYGTFSCGEQGHSQCGAQASHCGGFS